MELKHPIRKLVEPWKNGDHRIDQVESGDSSDGGLSSEKR